MNKEATQRLTDASTTLQTATDHKKRLIEKKNIVDESIEVLDQDIAAARRVAKNTFDRFVGGDIDVEQLGDTESDIEALVTQRRKKARIAEALAAEIQKATTDILAAQENLRKAQKNVYGEIFRAECQSAIDSVVPILERAYVAGISAGTLGGGFGRPYTSDLLDKIFVDLHLHLIDRSRVVNQLRESYGYDLS